MKKAYVLPDWLFIHAKDGRRGEEFECKKCGTDAVLRAGQRSAHFAHLPNQGEDCPWRSDADGPEGYGSGDGNSPRWLAEFEKRVGLPQVEWEQGGDLPERLAAVALAGAGPGGWAARRRALAENLLSMLLRPRYAGLLRRLVWWTAGSPTRWEDAENLTPQRLADGVAAKVRSFNWASLRPTGSVGALDLWQHPCTRDPTAPRAPLTLDYDPIVERVARDARGRVHLIVNRAGVDLTIRWPGTASLRAHIEPDPDRRAPLELRFTAEAPEIRLQLLPGQALTLLRADVPDNNLRLRVGAILYVMPTDFDPTPSALAVKTRYHREGQAWLAIRDQVLPHVARPDHWLPELEDLYRWKPVVGAKLGEDEGLAESELQRVLSSRHGAATLSTGRILGGGHSLPCHPGVATRAGHLLNVYNVTDGVFVDDDGVVFPDWSTGDRPFICGPVEGVVEALLRRILSCRAQVPKGGWANAWEHDQDSATNLEADPLAFYKPHAFHGPDWGITLKGGRIHGLARHVARGRGPSRIDAAARVLLSLVLHHERLHHLVEREVSRYGVYTYRAYAAFKYAKPCAARAEEALAEGWARLRCRAVPGVEPGALKAMLGRIGHGPGTYGQWQAVTGTPMDWKNLKAWTARFWANEVLQVGPANDRARPGLAMVLPDIAANVVPVRIE